MSYRNYKEKCKGVTNNTFIENILRNYMTSTKAGVFKHANTQTRKYMQSMPIS